VPESTPLPAHPAAASRRGYGALEAEVLSVLRCSSVPLSVAQVRRRLGADAGYSTVRTILGRLCAKGQAQRIEQERTFLYAPTNLAVARAAALIALALQGVANLDSALALFVESLGERERRTLRRLLGPTEPDAPWHTVGSVGGTGGVGGA
jgi:predicted transcriptional regulator